MKKENKESVKSVVEVCTLKEAAVLQYTGHEIHSISRNNDIEYPYIYRFYFKNHTTRWLDGLIDGVLAVEPGLFIDHLECLQEHREHFVRESNDNKNDDQGLGKVI